MRSFSLMVLATLSVVVVSPGIAAAQQHPIKLATEASLSVRAEPSVQDLTDGRRENPSTSLQRMSWIPAAEQQLAWFVTRPTTYLAWQEIAMSFVPQKSGDVTLELYGPWEKVPGGDIYRQDVWWDDVRVSGAELTNGGFEQPLDAPGSSWKSTGAVRLAGTDEVPASEGKWLVKAWHNQRVVANMAVKGGQRVTVRAKARSVKPDGFVEMKRITKRDTPAHLAAKRLKRGANLGNHLEVPPGQNWALSYSEEDYDQIMAEGFDHVRLPIGWNHYTGPAPQYKLSDEIFAQVDQHVVRAAKRGLSIIINIHHFDDFTTDPVKFRDKFFAIWNQLAEHYAKSPETVFFEILNEPKDAATTTILNPIYADVIKQIRRTNPTRTILVGPGKWNSISELVNLKLPDDDQNLIVTVHNYDPFYFSHQGATWSGPDVVKLKGIRFPGPPAKPLVIDASSSLAPHVLDWLARYNSNPGDSNPCSEALHKELVAQAKSWSDYYGRPIHFGEFGAFVEADAESRANFVKSFRQAFDEADVGWAIWDWKAGFRYWDPEQHRPAPGFREALFPVRKP